MKTEEILKQFEAVGLKPKPAYKDPIALLVVMDECVITNISPIKQEKLQDYVELAKFIVDTYIGTDYDEDDIFDTIFTATSGAEYEMSEFVPAEGSDIQSVSIIIGSQEYLIAENIIIN